MSKLHWMTRRVTDPIGKLFDDLHFLEFRRDLLMCITREDGTFRICMHDKCKEVLPHANFPSELGAFEILEVKDKEDAQKHGAWAYLCFCQNVKELASSQLEVKMKPTLRKMTQ